MKHGLLLSVARATSFLHSCYFCFFRRCRCRRCIAQSLSVIPCVTRDPSAAALVASTPIVAELSLPLLSSHLLLLAPLPSNLNSLSQFFSHLRSERSTLGRAEMLSNLRYHTSVIVSLFQSLGTLFISARRLNRLSGYADRIHELMAVSREPSLKNEKSSLQRRGSRSFISEANYIEFSAVKASPNGSEKSSLFWVLGGLWPLVSGHIVKPGIGSDLNKEIFYVPQRPYIAIGTLRDQLIYPLTAEVNWGDELSLGEQQRLGMARLFYHKPKFAILDQCTSVVTTNMEERFCTKVRAMGTSCITISYCPALVTFHDVVLSLDGEGGWSVRYRWEDSSSKLGIDTRKASQTKRQRDAETVQEAFAMNKKGSGFSKSRAQSYIIEVISSSTSMNSTISPSVVPQIKSNLRPLPLRVAAMSKVLFYTPATYGFYSTPIDNDIAVKVLLAAGCGF
ncbi:ABC transporter D family member [Arachis hypogaea]|nr:ABC transporter D family member [Arachis hypogaea]